MATPDKVGTVIEPLLEEILRKDINWFTVEFAATDKKNKYELKVGGKGKGGLTECRKTLTAKDRIFYGSLKVDLIDGNGARYDKYVYFKYLPTNANKATRFLWGFENSIKTAFKFKHVLMESLDENLTGFDEAGITKEFQRVSENQMEYKSLDFGGNNIYNLKEHNENNQPKANPKAAQVKYQPKAQAQPKAQDKPQAKAEEKPKAQAQPAAPMNDEKEDDTPAASTMDDNAADMGDNNNANMNDDNNYANNDDNGDYDNNDDM